MNVINRLFKCSLKKMEYYLEGHKNIKLVKENKNGIRVGSMIVHKTSLFVREFYDNKYNLILRQDSDSGESKLTRMHLTKEELIVVKEAIEDILKGEKK